MRDLKHLRTREEKSLFGCVHPRSCIWSLLVRTLHIAVKIYRISSFGGDSDDKNSLHEVYLTMPLRYFAGFMNMKEGLEDNTISLGGFGRPLSR